MGVDGYSIHRLCDSMPAISPLWAIFFLYNLPTKTRFIRVAESECEYGRKPVSHNLT